MGIGILFNLAITIFIIGIWASFIRNIIREVRKNNDKRMTGTTRSASNQTRQQVPTHNRPRNVGEQRPASQPVGNTRSDRNAQEMLQNPRTLYLELKQRLPRQYEEEIQEIFNSPNPHVKLIKFIRRKEIWPIAQSILRDGVLSKEEPRSQRQVSSPRNAVQTPRNTVQTPISEPATEIYSELSMSTDYVDDMQEATDRIAREQDELVKEYDTFGTNFANVLEDSSLLGDNEYIQTESRRETRQDKQRFKERQEWLKQAILGSTVLERPEY